MPYIYAYLFLLSMFTCFLIAYSCRTNAQDAKMFHSSGDPYNDESYPTLEECCITEEQAYGKEDKPS